MKSENGAAIPGVEGDVVLLQNGKSADLRITMEMASAYVSRIGRGFLLGSAVTRDAERVTAEEIRLQAIELETSLGGVYSRIAVDLQVPLSMWLLREAGVSDLGKGLKPRVVVGLDALSRHGELDELRQWLADMASIATLPEGLMAELNMRELARALAAPRRINTNTFLKPPEQVAAEQQQRVDQQNEMVVAEQAAKVGAQTATQQG
jgi:hypothetical protein